MDSPTAKPCTKDEFKPKNLFLDYDRPRDFITFQVSDYKVLLLLYCSPIVLRCSVVITRCMYTAVCIFILTHQISHNTYIVDKIEICQKRKIHLKQTCTFLGGCKFHLAFWTTMFLTCTYISGIVFCWINDKI